MEGSKRVRRRHSAEFKRQVLADCEAGGASIAAVALAHGVNANLVHKWRQQACDGISARAARFIPITVGPATPPEVPSEPGCIDIQIRRGAAVVQVRWPLSAAADCGDWLRTWLG